MIWSRLRKPKYVIMFALLLLGIGAVLWLKAGRNWAPEASCDKLAVHVREKQVPSGDDIEWAVTGPVGQYIVAIDAEQLTMDANKKVSAARGKLDYAALTDLKGCRMVGRTDGVLPAGEHTLRLFTINGTTITESAAQTFVVTK
ncbi:hypothetical protein [Longispora albida]|uniref:hypothetical protein n=1 Tax=Longispora albida TaxID=203523 RepID=UPI00037E3548|nr:hypothetical protein [Longispora albida]